MKKECVVRGSTKERETILQVMMRLRPMAAMHPSYHRRKRRRRRRKSSLGVGDTLIYMLIGCFVWFTIFPFLNSSDPSNGISVSSFVLETALYTRHHHHHHHHHHRYDTPLHGNTFLNLIDIPPSHSIQKAKNPMTGRWIQIMPWIGSSILPKDGFNNAPTSTTTTTVTKNTIKAGSTSVWHSLLEYGGWMVHDGAIVSLWHQQQQQSKQEHQPQQRNNQPENLANGTLFPISRWQILEPTIIEPPYLDVDPYVSDDEKAAEVSPFPYSDRQSLPLASDLLWLYKPDGLLTLPGKTEPDSLATQVNAYLLKQTQEGTHEPPQLPSISNGQRKDDNSKTERKKKNKSNNALSNKRKDGDHKDKVAWIPRPCHRLDRDTSGIIVMAKTKEAYTALSKQFEDRHVKKQYVALVHGWVEDDYGIIDQGIGEKKRMISTEQREESNDEQGSNHKVWTTDRDAEKIRSAVTYYQVSRRYSIPANENMEPSHEQPDKMRKDSDYTRIILQPQTGRGHQLRLHMAQCSGNPILGDTLHGHHHRHGSGKDTDTNVCDSVNNDKKKLIPPRLCLHAEYLQVWVRDDEGNIRQAKCWCLPPF